MGNHIVKIIKHLRGLRKKKNSEIITNPPNRKVI